MTNELKSRIELWLTTLKKLLYQPIENINFIFFTTSEHLTLEQVRKESFREIRPGDRWGHEWEYGWFRADIKLGSWASGQRIVMDLNLGGEAILFVNGAVFGARRDDWIIQEHHFICDNYLNICADGTESYELFAECYGGHSMPEAMGESVSGPFLNGKRWERPKPDDLRRVCGISTVGIWREEMYHLYLEAQAIYDIWKKADKDSLRAAELERGLRRFVLCLDFEQPVEELMESVKCARKELLPYLQCKNGATAPRFHAIGHAHIDLAWLWPLEETERKCARTMGAQIRHMEEYPQYKMILSQPFLYELIETHYPELYREILKKIESGQLIPEGGMWVEADTNLPCGESLIRQFLYGKEYFRNKLNVESSLLWLPDVFGYSAALPQIMKGCGITHFTTHKIFWTYNGGEPFPYHYFQWKGLDGSKIPVFIHVEYSSAADAGTLIERWNNRAQKNGLCRFMQPVGYGDGGGGASREHIENILLFADMEGVPRTEFDDPNHFFEAIAADGYEENEYVGELYYQAHRGTYTTQARTKRGNRKGEFALREAEFWNGISILEGKARGEKDFKKIWKILLLNQFHDILPGSAIHKVYERAEKELEKAVCEGGKLLRNALDALVEKGTGVTYFNSLSWERREIVRLPAGWEGALGEDGALVPTQRTEKGVEAVIHIPPCGRVSLRPGHMDKMEKDSIVKAELMEGGGAVLENEVIRVSFDLKGRIFEIFDKERKRNWAKGLCNEFCMYQDIPGHFEAWDIDSLYREKRLDLSDNAVITVRERGRLFGEIKITRKLGRSEMKQYIRLKKNEYIVTFHTIIDWKECHKLLKVAFRPDIKTDELVSEIQYGYIKRPNHCSRNFDRDRFEVCNHKWSALTEAGKGFAVLNDCKYGISASDNTMELTLLKSSTYPDEIADTGHQEFTYGFFLWNTPFSESAVVKKAYELNTKVSGSWGVEENCSWFRIMHDNVVLDVIKEAENGEGIILRFYESMGKETETYLMFSYTGRIIVTNMLEENKEDCGVQKEKVLLHFTPFEVKTVRFIKTGEGWQ